MVTCISIITWRNEINKFGQNQLGVSIQLLLRKTFDQFLTTFGTFDGVPLEPQELQKGVAKLQV